ncbi:MAG TPA: D-tyrosyl-tRNA(Tyr) deacylase [Clostridiales bacterium]|nr:D-tyrosyl-tRNA(Tyr) deacylase [Clostridiales bacterium]
MRAVVQRVEEAKVLVEDKVINEIGEGLLILLGVGHDDTDEDLNYLIDKTVNLRIFGDNEGKMNLSLKDIKGDMLVVSQFTLYGDCRRGRRPSFIAAAPPNIANKYYKNFIKGVNAKGINAKGGIFQAHMKVELINDGPVTILLDSKKEF